MSGLSFTLSLARLQNAECTSTQLELSMSLAIVVDAATAKAGHAGEPLSFMDRRRTMFHLIRMDTSLDLWLECRSCMFAELIDSRLC